MTFSSDDELTLKYLEDETLSDQEVRSAVVKGAKSGSFVPVLFTSATHSLGGRSSLHVDAAWVQVDSLPTTAQCARGAYTRPNPGVDEGGWVTVRVVLHRRTPSFASPRDLSGRVEVEGGFGPADYVRAFGELRWQTPVSPGATLLVRAAAGGASGQLPRHRGFVLGGRGTLLGEPFRPYGGRSMAWLSGEWQQRIGVPEARLGSFAGTGPSAVLAPNIAVGWAGGQIPGFPGSDRVF